MMRSIFGVALHRNQRGELSCPGCGAALIGDDIVIAHGGHWCCRECSGMAIRAQRARDLQELLEEQLKKEEA